MRHRLSYANVMATLAVFVALGGTSYAALKITGKNVQNGSLTGADIKKHSVQLNRLRGTLPAGAQGLKGDKGDQGLKGDQGPKGDTGPFPDVLPRGKTLTGTWAITGQAPAADGDYLDTPVSFGFRFSAAPSIVTVGPDEGGTQAATDAGCGGTLAAPTADPGRFCIYQADGFGNTNVLKYNDQSNVKTVGGANAVVSAYAWTADGGYTDFGGALPTGTVIEIQAHLANTITYAGGTWAATSP